MDSCRVYSFLSLSDYSIKHQLIKASVQVYLLFRMDDLQLFVIDLCPILCPVEKFLIHWLQIMFATLLLEFQKVCNLIFDVFSSSTVASTSSMNPTGGTVPLSSSMICVEERNTEILLTLYIFPSSSSSLMPSAHDSLETYCEVLLIPYFVV